MKNHAEESPSSSLEHAFDQFVTAATCKSILSSFQQLQCLSGLSDVKGTSLYDELKVKLKGSWRAQSLFSKLDKRAAHKEYKKGTACCKIKVLIIGAGPCGLRTAIECALLGARTVVVEKRDRFSRNNVLHLWPFLITDLRNLGAKKFFGKFCAGAIDHISIRQLQCILLKVALLVGVEVHVNVTFDGLVEPSKSQGWRCKVTPKHHVLADYEFNVLIGADGKRNTLSGFQRKEFRGLLALAITANFINRNTPAEVRVEEISGVAFIYNQKFFLDLKERTRIDLENIVYYKDETHYFVMTAKKASLLEKGVLKKDFSDTVALLDKSNVNQDALLAYAREAADFSTNYQLPSLDYAMNHYGQADVAMFDFTSMFAAENASRFMVKNGHHLLMGLVGDSLLEPFWPTGSGCARGFLSAFDAAWMIRSWAMGKTPLQVLVERESIYTLLSQTTPGYLNKNYNMYSIDPNTRYLNLNVKAVSQSQVRHLYQGDVYDNWQPSGLDPVVVVPSKKSKSDTESTDSHSLLEWCQKVLNTGNYQGVHVVDLTSSWRSGLALCALIHVFRPDLVDFTQLVEKDIVANNQLAFSLAEKELGIPPVMTSGDMARCAVPDKLTMISYLTQFYDLFKHEPVRASAPLQANTKMAPDSRKSNSARSNRRISILQKLNSRLARSKKRKEQELNEGRALRLKKCKELMEDDEECTENRQLPVESTANQLHTESKKEVKPGKDGDRAAAGSVAAMADILLAKFRSLEGSPVEPVKKLNRQPSFTATVSASEVCCFCQKRVYIMERVSAEGQFFHRGCLKCDHCGAGLRLTNYSCDRDVKPVKFYCYRHAAPEMRVRPFRKRVLEEHNIPAVVITPAEQLTKPALRQKDISTRPTQTLNTTDVQGRSKSTPERIEFEISDDGIEESEEEQFEHNLQAQSLEVLPDGDSDSESTDSDITSCVEDAVSPSLLTLEEACVLTEVLKEQNSPKLRTHVPERSQPAKDTIRRIMFDGQSCGVKENLSVDMVEKIRIRPMSPSRNKVDGKIITDMPSILKNSVLKLGVSDKGKRSANNSRRKLGLEFGESEVVEESQEKASASRWGDSTLGVSVSSDSACENLSIQSSYLGKNGIFIEGIRSPSANRTRRFRMRRHSKHASKQQMLSSNESDNDYKRTNGIAGDISTPNHLPSEERVNKTQSYSVVGNTHGSSIGSNVVNTVTCESLKGLKRLKGEGNSCQKDPEALAKTSVNYDTANLGFLIIDDRFVTDRRQQRISKVSAASREQGNSSLGEASESAGDSSFSISTPSDSESELSVSSVELEEFALSEVGGDGYNRTVQNVSVSSGLGALMSSHHTKQANSSAKDLLQNKLQSDCNNNSKCEYSKADEKVTSTPNTCHNSLYITSGDSTKNLSKSSSGFIPTAMHLTRPLPPPGCQSSQSHTAVSSVGALTIQLSAPVSEVDCNQTTVLPKTGKQSSASNYSGLAVFGNIAESPLSSRQPTTDEVPSSKHGVFTELPTHLTCSPSKVRPVLPSFAQHATDKSMMFSSPKVNPGGSSVLSNQQGSLTVHGVGAKESHFETSTVRKLEEKKLSQPKVIANIFRQKQDITKEKTAGVERKIQIQTEHMLVGDASVVDNSKTELDTSGMSRRHGELGFVHKSGTKDNQSSSFATHKRVKATFMTETSEKEDEKQTNIASSPNYKKIATAVLSSQQIRDICIADIEKARIQARDKARLKTDEELGISTVSPAHANRVEALKRHKNDSPSVRKVYGEVTVTSGSVSSENDYPFQMETQNETQSNQLFLPFAPSSNNNNNSVAVIISEKSSNNTVPNLDQTQPSLKREGQSECKMAVDLSSPSDVCLIRDENGASPTSPVFPNTETDQASQQSPEKSKKKLKFSKTKKVVKDNESDKKKKSLLTLLGLTKNKKKTTKDDSVAVSPDHLSEDGDVISKKKSKEKTHKKKNVSKTKVKSKNSKTEHHENQDTSSEYSKNLSDFSVFNSDMPVKQTKHFLDVRPSVPAATIPSRSFVDEISDSDDRYSDHSPIRRRKAETLDERVSRRLHRINQKQQKQAEQKRLRMAQEIQRQLEEVEVREKDLEERGVVVEKALRGECQGTDNETQLMNEWFTLVYEKNALLRYESELLVRAKELELEDRQTRLEFEFRERSRQPGESKMASDLAAEENLLEELLDVVEQRNSLVTMLEEDRLREQKEDNELKEMMRKKGHVLSSLSFDTWQEMKTT